MYNLLVTAHAGAWDAPGYEYDRSRYLEYTNESLAEKFKSLTSEQVEHLKNIPCLFAYEGFKSEIKIGRLTEIRERGKTLFITYEFHPRIQSIPPSKIEEISALLDIRRWEMNRTHWALKDEDLFKSLRISKIINPGIRDWPDTNKKYKQPLEEKPQTSRITTVAGFIKKVLSEAGSNEAEVFYRGHSDRKKYKLEPSLFRKDTKGNYTHLEYEDLLYRELIVSNAGDFDPDHHTLDRLVRMQHYSLPTRLLDITSNPLIALYFACKSKGDKKEESEGEVIIFTVPRGKVKYFDSDKASCIANLSRLSKSEKDSIDFSIQDIGQFNSQLPMRRLTHFIREEKSFFIPEIDPTHLKQIICVKSKKTNARINSQSGAFLLFGLDAVLDESGSEDITITRISISNKSEILSELDRLNINESTVFPYIESSAKYVANKYKFTNPQS
ncbi:FRG domain-containing protein [Pseudomonas nitroreducens]|uniref:FRG domain-containing protein n=1 Tax=Pseudomonas nitroreducens TaxID=46680 RepID=A0A5R8ZUY1_PSENT|nr:FRG domain-containing protein [Pseudomonas nitroreducens]TLP70243.1 FRG domain-containing protein [Pseudomonas nitroreducens]